MITQSSASPGIRVLVVDDSAVVRQVMEAVLSQERDISVMVAADPLIALEKMKRVRPDVIVLDLVMPRMDGLTFLRKIMSEDPIPTLICSGVAARGTMEALRALDEGAVGIVTKPKLGVREYLHESALILIDMVRSAAQARIQRRESIPSSRRKPADQTASRPSHPVAARRLVAIGASTGGTEALAEILTSLPTAASGIVVVQHMPELFTAAFASRLNQLCQIRVKEAENGDRVASGCAFIAPGNRHMTVRSRGGNYTIEISDGPLVSRHRPSVDLLFRSVAEEVGRDAVGVILTGMGSDGAQGLLAMKQAGAVTIAQDEATCVVFGMPKEAIELKAVDHIAPLPMIASHILMFSPPGKPHPADPASATFSQGQNGEGTKDKN